MNGAANDPPSVDIENPLAVEANNGATTTSQVLCATSLQSLCERARKLWLSDDPIADRMQQVEQLYRTAWESSTAEPSSATSEEPSSHDGANKRAKRCENEDIQPWHRHAGEKLALILLQSGRSKEADSILVHLDYPCRLAASIFFYRYDGNQPPTTTPSPCHMWDNFISPSELTMLQDVFLDPTSDYWTLHNYTVEPPSPYFSFVIPLDGSSSANGLEALIHRLQRHLTPTFAALSNATYCELWAHNRPHATGHQFHFDSDNEGCTGGADGTTVIRNPICSCIVYLSGSTGGPSVVTNQRLASHHLSVTRGWTCPPVRGRVVALDGKVLHGVMPGRAAGTDHDAVSSRRVSVMLAFWKTIRVRSDPLGRPGAARLFPTTEPPTWARELSRPASLEELSPTVVPPISIGHVYESTRDGKPWTRQDGMLDYEDIFQGF